MTTNRDTVIMNPEDQDILTKISDISGRINRHKNSSQPKPQPWNRYVASDNRDWRPQRSAPYPSSRPKTRSTGHQHRTLVINNHGNSSSNGEESPQRNGWVTKRDRHMQLINTSILDQTTQARSKAMAETRRQKALKADNNEKQRLHSFLEARNTPKPASSTPSHELIIEGLRFAIFSGGSKLVRLRGTAHCPPTSHETGSNTTGPTDSGSATPKKAHVGGVTFFRSKNGNLYRSGIAKAQWSNDAARKIDKACKKFTLTGRCTRGPQCRYTHDAARVAMCRSFLQTGECPEGDSCDLSHDPSPERVPTCLHFLRGNCVNPDCRYAHIRVDPSAPVCRDFALLGFCGKSAECHDRHVSECPSYANTGVCRNTKCHLPHVDHAGQIRRHAANRAGGGAAEASDDFWSDEDEERASDDVDSDGVEEFLGGDSADEAAVNQQDDFVGF